MPKLNYTKHDSKAINALADRVQNVSVKLAEISRLMEEDGLKTITLTNYRSLMLGLGKVETFASELERTYLNWKHEQGMYLAEGEAVPELHERVARKEKTSEHPPKRNKKRS